MYYIRRTGNLERMSGNQPRVSTRSFIIDDRSQRAPPVWTQPYSSKRRAPRGKFHLRSSNRAGFFCSSVTMNTTEFLRRQRVEERHSPLTENETARRERVARAEYKFQFYCATPRARFLPFLPERNIPRVMRAKCFINGVGALTRVIIYPGNPSVNCCAC